MADEVTDKVKAFVDNYEKWESMTKKEQDAEQAKEQRATEIVAKVLRVLEDENLSIGDSHRILSAAIDVLLNPVREMKRTAKTSVPEKLEEVLKWGGRLMPEFD